MAPDEMQGEVLESPGPSTPVGIGDAPPKLISVDLLPECSTMGQVSVTGTAWTLLPGGLPRHTPVWLCLEKVWIPLLSQESLGHKPRPEPLGLSQATQSLKGRGALSSAKA